MKKFWLLKKGVTMFGLKDGISFWFNWDVLFPIQDFVWLNITHKEYCPYSGWHCDKKDCGHKHLKTKAEIVKHREKGEKELHSVEKGKDDMCIYCGDEKGTEVIPNPNFDKINQWLVCKDCKEVIHNQTLYTMSEHVGAEKMASEALNKLDEIAKRTGKPIMVAGIRKGDDGKYRTSSIEFTGKKE